MEATANIPGLILDGVCGTGKTTILRALLQSPQFIQKSYNSSIILSEHHTQRILERKERESGLTVADNLAVLDSHVSYLEIVGRRLAEMKWCENTRTNMRIPYLLERFHYTHVIHYAHIKWEDVADIDARLARLGCKAAILMMDEADMERRIITARDDGWRKYVGRFGDTSAKIVGHYARQQAELIALAKKTALEVSIINSSRASVSDTVGELLRLWEI